MAAGFAFHLDANSYLVLGVPLVVLFQWQVQRKPLCQLWVRDANAFRLDRYGMAIAIALMLLPIATLVTMVAAGDVPGALWAVACVAGGAAAAFSLRNLRRTTLNRPALLGVLAAVSIGLLLFGGEAMIRGRSALMSPGELGSFAVWLLLYFPVVFVVEEVVFRGAFDTFVNRAGAGRTQYWLSAAAVAIVWGLWHWPIAPADAGGNAAATLLQLVVVHTLIGVPLAISWRAGGNLALPALAHAVIDAYRNALQG